MEDPFEYPGGYGLFERMLSQEERKALPYVMKYAEEFRISPALLMAVMRTESNFTADAKGDFDSNGVPNSFGYMQVQWTAAYDAGYRSRRGGITEEQKKTFAREDWPQDGLDPDSNVRYGAKYLQLCADRWGIFGVYDWPYKTAYENAISAYNRGLPTGPSKLNESYVNKVIRAYRYYLDLRTGGLVGRWPLGPGGKGAVVEIAGRRYLLRQSGPSVLVYDVTDADKPQLVSDSMRLAAPIVDFFFEDKRLLLYVFTGSKDVATLHIYDLSSPTKVQPLGNYVVRVAYRFIRAGGISVSSDYAYLAFEDRLVVINVQNPAKPVLASDSKLAQSNIQRTFYSVSVQDGYAYVFGDALDVYEKQQFPTTEILVVDVTDPSNAKLRVSLSGGSPLVREGFHPIFYGKMLYYLEPEVVQREPFIVNKWHLVAVDVSTPSAPRQSARWELAFDSTITQSAKTFALIGGVAIIAGYGLFTVLDVSEASRPKVIASFTPSTRPASPISAAEAKRLNNFWRLMSAGQFIVKEPFVYVLGSGFSIYKSEEVRAAKFVTEPPIFGELPSGIRTILANQNHVYLIGSGDTWVLDISQSDSPKLLSNLRSRLTYSGLPLGSIGIHDIAGNIGVGLSERAKGSVLLIVDLVDPTKPSVLGSLEFSERLGWWSGMAIIKGARVFLVSDVAFHIIDISNRSQPVELGRFGEGRRQKDLAVVGDRAYLATWDSRVLVVDISNPARPTLLSTYSADSLFGHGPIFSGPYACTRFENEIVLIDLNPETPTKLAVWKTNDWFDRFLVSGKYAIFEGRDNITILDFTDPRTTKLIAKIDTPTQGSIYYPPGKGADITGNYLVSWSDELGLQIFRLR